MELLTFVIALAAVFSAGFVFWQAFATARSVKEQSRSNGLVAFREFILSEYVERKFRRVEPPTIEGEQVSILRAARAAAMKAYGTTKEDHDLWKVNSNISTEKQHAWQNQVAFEVADALQTLGVTAFTGNLPLNMVLATVGDVIVDDWLLCREWVMSYREREKTRSIPEKVGMATVAFHRRHAEWLVLVTALWMNTHWEYPNCKLLIQMYGGISEVKDLVDSLSSADGMLMPRAVLSEVLSLTRRAVR